VYGLLAPEIGRVFFPEVSKELQLINSFGVYLAAFLMRPLGAVMFGEIGDRMVGRKNALVFSIILITIPSILMGCLPTYYDWGWIAPVLLVILRLFQGLSVGGQLAGSYVLSIEQSSQRRRGLRGSICDASSVRLSRYCCFLGGTRSFTVAIDEKRCLTKNPCIFAELWISASIGGHHHDAIHSHGGSGPRVGMAGAVSVFSFAGSGTVLHHYKVRRIQTLG
jgi:hypothetical protein